MSFLSKVASTYSFTPIKEGLDNSDFTLTDRALSTYFDVSTNVIPAYNRAYTDLSNNKDAYFAIGNDVYDATSGFPTAKPNLADGRQHDAYTMASQQNNMYMIGVLTTATLLITSIILARR